MTTDNSVEYKKPEDPNASSSADVATCLFSLIGSPCFIFCTAYIEAEHIAAQQKLTGKFVHLTSATSMDCFREYNRRLSLSAQPNNPESQ